MNEDNLLVDEDLGLLAVADGSGGGRDGARASRMAVECLREAVREALSSDPRGAIGEAMTVEALRRGFRSANAALHETRLSPELGMSSTLTAVLVRHTSWWLAHTGDSRAYLVCHEKAEQLTEDHTFVADMVRTGVLSEAEARSHPKRGLLSASLGPFAQPKVMIRSGTLPLDAVLLLCSDGVSAVLCADEIARCISDGGGAQTCVERLLSLATGHGARDDLTSIICVWKEQRKRGLGA